MTTETVAITYAALPAYLGLRPRLPIYHQRSVHQGSVNAPAVPLRVVRLAMETRTLWGQTWRTE